jgi:hypothetical protein
MTSADRVRIADGQRKLREERELEKLASLQDRGILTTTELDKRKAKLLAR